MNFFGKTLEILKRTWNNAVTNESTLNFNLDMFAYSSRDPKQDYEKNKNRFKNALIENDKTALANLLYTLDIRNGKGVLSNKKLLILPLYVRANQQIALKEGKAAQESTLRNITGQVTGASKSGSLSDSEIATLIGNGSPNIIKEMLGPASHDLVAKREMKQSIIRTGDVSLKDLTDSPENKKSLRYMSEVLKAYGLDNDLVDVPIK